MTAGDAEGPAASGGAAALSQEKTIRTGTDPARPERQLGAAHGAAEFAPAKVNLFLHVVGRRPDGMHSLESLAVFPRIGDRLWADPSARLSLSLDGPFADMLAADADNLVLRAALDLAAAHGIEASAALRLEKNLPVASGIGGGSADAAAALRLLSRQWGVPVPPRIALCLGADVPVCLRPEPQWMGGVGDALRPCPALPPFWLVLVNPLVTVPTGAVFQALDRRDNPRGPPAPDTGFDDFESLRSWLATQRNDMAAAAERLCPVIGQVMSALAAAPLARMSGSGATCFALHERQTDALAQADAIRRTEPGWWVAAAPVVT